MDNKTLMNLSAAVDTTTHSVFASFEKRLAVVWAPSLFGLKMPKERQISVERSTKEEKTKHYLGV